MLNLNHLRLVVDGDPHWVGGDITSIDWYDHEMNAYTMYPDVLETFRTRVVVIREASETVAVFLIDDVDGISKWCADHV
jgi:hypothetical protein